MRTSIYIDGFNLYYRAVRGTPFKWLDLKQVCERLLDPKHRIVAVNYYTAPVSGKRDPGQPVRQQTYLRALKAVMPELAVHQGHFLTHEISAPLARPLAGRPATVRILKRHAHFVKHLGKSVLAACQMPNPVPGTTIHKPPTW